MRASTRCLVVCTAVLALLPGVASSRAGAAGSATATAAGAVTIDARPFGVHVDGPVEGDVSATELFLDGGALSVRVRGTVSGVPVRVDVDRVGFLPLYKGDVEVDGRRLAFVSGPFAEPGRGTLTGGTPLVRVTVHDAVAGPGEYVDTFVADGRRRRVLVHVPPGYVPGVPMPLLLYLHGAGAPTGWSQDLFTRTRGFADTAGFLVLLPDGIGARWNLDPGRGPDDLGFLAAVLDRTATEFAIDPTRVYVAGFSNGAMMAHLLACTMPERFAAIAPVAGTLRRGVDCAPALPVPVVMIHGTDDPLVEYGGEEGLLSAPDTAASWGVRNGCEPVPADEALPDVAPGDGTTVLLHRFLGCEGGGDVAFYEVRGGGHQWPGGLVFLSESLLGRRSRDFDANEVIWDFLSSRRR